MAKFLLPLAALSLVSVGCTGTDGDGTTDGLPTPSEDLDDTGSQDTQEPEDTDVPEDTGEAPQDATQNYSFSDKESLLYVQVFKDEDALLSSLAHNHVIRATNWSGSVVYNVNKPKKCEIAFSLPVNGLTPDESDMRDYVGYGDTISSSDRETIKGHMLDKDQLNSSKYTQISFTSTQCSATKGETKGELTVKGSMRIVGVSADVSIPMQFEVKNGRFYASGSFEMKHADFGVSPYSTWGGSLRNEELLVFGFDMVGDSE